MTKSPWIGITWLGTSPFDHVLKYKWIDSTKSKNDSNHSIESINQLIIYVDHFLAKPSTSFTFSFRWNLLSRWPSEGYFESIPLNQSYQPLKVNWTRPTLWNELTQTPINSIVKWTESTESIKIMNLFHSTNSVERLIYNSQNNKLYLHFSTVSSYIWQAANVLK